MKSRVQSNAETAGSSFVRTSAFVWYNARVTTFADILARSENPVAAAMLLLLAWVATSDGRIADEELAGLRSVAESGKNSADLRAVIDLAQHGRIEDFQLGCEVLRELAPKHRRLMLQMTIGMALEDGFLTTAEGHIVRFVADVLSHTTSDLDALFREMTGEPFPVPADPSSIEWWEARESRSKQREQASNDHTRTDTRNSRGVPDAQRLRDLGVLGLDETATLAQVKDAFRRMSQIHHPDKFVTLGPEAVKAAEVTFLRIRAAYERLVTT